ncbi:MAG: UbiD family decarboxylase [Planctomycetota bacterium]|nr:UbiD family decarboxylase [Planctomycetota bacterium]
MSNPVHADLTSFIRRLEEAGSLLRITAPVSAVLEITEIADRHSKSRTDVGSAAARRFDPRHADLGGKALLFESVEGSDFPLAINLYGSYARTEMALGCHDEHGYESIARRLAAIAQPQPPRGLRDAMRMGRQFLPLLRAKPRLRRTGPCQEVVRRTDAGEVDLSRLPLLKCWPHDGDPAAVGLPCPEGTGTESGGGRYITFAGIHTIHADDRNDPSPPSHNIGMYRVQLIDDTHLAMHWHIHHDGAAHWRSWKAIGEPMPIAICFGGESVMPYAASAPLPPGISELLLAGYLNGGGIPLVNGVTVPLRVPANSEIVIEGFVNTDAGGIGWSPDGDEPLGPGAVFEGPFGDHTGFYSMPDRYPVVEVSAVTHRRNAVFPATVVGQPPQEDYYLGKATERIFLPLLQTLIPDIVDYHLPMFGSFHQCAFVQIAKAYPLQARRVMHAIWGAGQMAWTKTIIVVDESVDVHDHEAVLEAIATHSEFPRDLEVVNGPLDILDHSAPRLGAGGKMGIDATPSIHGEEVLGIPVGSPPASDIESVRTAMTSLVDGRAVHAVDVPAWGRGRIVFAAVDSSAPGRSSAAIESMLDAAARGDGADIILAVDAGIDPAEHERALFMLFANMDSLRDRHERDHRIALDGTCKHAGWERNDEPVRPWPPIISMDPEVVARVDARRSEFGLE